MMENNTAASLVDLLASLKDAAYNAIRIVSLAQEVGEAAEAQAKPLSDVYFERNQLAQAVAALAILIREAHRDDRFDATWQPNEDHEDGWPVLLIKLPCGQISYHVPQEEAVLGLLWKPWRWDGHTTEQKYRRVSELLKGST